MSFTRQLQYYARQDISVSDPGLLHNTTPNSTFIQHGLKMIAHICADVVKFYHKNKIQNVRAWPWWIQLGCRQGSELTVPRGCRFGQIFGNGLFSHHTQCHENQEDCLAGGVSDNYVTNYFTWGHVVCEGRADLSLHKKSKPNIETTNKTGQKATFLQARQT